MAVKVKVPTMVLGEITRHGNRYRLLQSIRAEGQPYQWVEYKLQFQVKSLIPGSNPINPGEWMDCDNGNFSVNEVLTITGMMLSAIQQPQG